MVKVPFCLHCLSDQIVVVNFASFVSLPQHVPDAINILAIAIFAHL